jgi:hypothetical protein
MIYTKRANEDACVQELMYLFHMTFAELQPAPDFFHV